MKKFVLTIVVLGYVLIAVAQRSVVNNLTTFDDKKLHFGFSLGINTLDYSFQHYNLIGDGPYKTWLEQFDPNKTIPPADLVDPNDPNKINVTDTIRADIQQLIPGFSVGIITSLRLNKYFELRFLPGMSFGERKIVYNVPIIDATEKVDFFSIKSTFLDFPLLIKYKSSRINNQRPYLIAGGSYRIDISKTAKEDLIRTKKGSFYAEIGVGWDSYLQFFRLSTELKVSLGLNNIIDTPGTGQLQYYGYAFERLSSNVFTLSFHFE